MTSKRLTRWASAILTAPAVLWFAQPALACSVCIAGDPSAPMNRGAQAGMLFLVGVVAAVLLVLASILFLLVRRAAVLDTHVEAAALTPTASRSPSPTA